MSTHGLFQLITGCYLAMDWMNATHGLLLQVTGCYLAMDGMDAASDFLIDGIFFAKLYLVSNSYVLPIYSI